jgi:hypothetical protein
MSSESDLSKIKWNKILGVELFKDSIDGPKHYFSPDHKITVRYLALADDCYRLHLNKRFVISKLQGYRDLVDVYGKLLDYLMRNKMTAHILLESFNFERPSLESVYWSGHWFEDFDGTWYRECNFGKEENVEALINEKKRIKAIVSAFAYIRKDLDLQERVQTIQKVAQRFKDIEIDE